MVKREKDNDQEYEANKYCKIISAIQHDISMELLDNFEGKRSRNSELKTKPKDPPSFYSLKSVNGFQQKNHPQRPINYYHGSNNTDLHPHILSQISWISWPPPKRTVRSHSLRPPQPLTSDLRSYTLYIWTRA